MESIQGNPYRIQMDWQTDQGFPFIRIHWGRRRKFWLSVGDAIRDKDAVTATLRLRNRYFC